MIATQPLSAPANVDQSWQSKPRPSAAIRTPSETTCLDERPRAAEFHAVLAPSLSLVPPVSRIESGLLKNPAIHSLVQ
jgi:hypothetical protein